MKTFEHWESEELELKFGLNRIYDYEPLKNWITSKCDIEPATNDSLNKIQQELILNADFWNEDELKFFFISPIVSLVGFRGKNFKGFTQRPIAAKKKDVDGNEIELKGRVEFLVSAGKQHPRHPYFCLHEYKPEKRRDTDPLGQLLSAMIAVRELNQKPHPIYGCYVVGRFWFFVVLDENDYAVSLAFDATQNDISAIYCILKACYGYVDKLANQEK